MLHKDSDAKQEFWKEEYKALRSEFITRIEELWKIEKYAIGGAAILAAWLMTHSVNFHAAWWLPFVYLLLCSIRFAAGMYHLIIRMPKYLIQIEKKFLGNEGGWGSWFEKQPLNETIAHTIAWSASLIAAFIFALNAPHIHISPL